MDKINNDINVIDILKETDALLEGHFLLSSGRHSDRYCQCAKLLQHPKASREVLSVVADKLRDLDIDVIIGPAMGGIVVAYELAQQLDKIGIFSERVDGIMCLRRGFEIKKGQKVLISEDVITTGKSSLEVAEIVKSLGADVVALSCIVDRSGDNAIPYPIYSAVKLDFETYEADKCPLCEKKIPYIKPGSRK